MKRLALLAIVSGCARTPEVELRIRLPADHRLLADIARIDLHAERDGRVVSEQSFGGSVSYVSVSGVPYGPRTQLVLEGLTAAGDVIARGRSCPFDYEAGHRGIDLYFAPTNFFAPTAGAPAMDRRHPIALQLDSGSVLLAGGAGASGPLDSTEIYSPGTGTFAAAPQLLTHARDHAELATVAGIGALVVGGLDALGLALPDGDVWSDASGQFVPLQSQALGARVDHCAVALPDGRVLVTGGRSAAAGALASSVFVDLLPDGTAVVAPGPPLVTARRAHAAVVAVGAAVLIGGYGGDGAPLTTLEALGPGAGGAAVFSTIAAMRYPRADATATVLSDGSILITGGVDGTMAPRADAEVYNPITRTTTTYSLFAARHGHTATPLAGGRVLIAGGTGSDGKPLAAVELFAPGIGFVSERPLGVARAGHVAVPLCDGTVLVAGGGAGAEIYNPPAR